MKKNLIEKMIPKALEEAQEIANNGEIESKYFGSIASFGASVIYAGTLTTILFYEAKKDDNKKFPKMLFEIIKENIDSIEENDLYDYAKNHPKEAKRNILSAATALKLAIRTFKKVDNKEDE